MKKFLFADLDDTLFQTREKCDARLAGRDSGELHPTAFLKDGSPISYTTAAQRAFFSFVHDGMTVIPTTARNLDALQRVDLPFASYAVIDYGGIVLAPDRSIDSVWTERMRDAMHIALPGLQELAALIDDYAARTGFAGRTRIVEDFGIPFYLVLKDPGKNAATLEPFEREVVMPWLAAAGRDYYPHRNGNNLAVMPNAVNKAHAVRHVTALLRREHADMITFGMGDSKVDAAFMAACDYAIVPRSTQLSGLTVDRL